MIAPLPGPCTVAVHARCVFKAKVVEHIYLKHWNEPRTMFGGLLASKVHVRVYTGGSSS